jgi:transposase
MEVVNARCCGIDVHKRSVTACCLTPGPGGRPTAEVRTFETMTDGLLALGDWLERERITHVAMESTGVYWKPIWNLLEERFALLLVNAQHIKAVPGRKTDVKDCEWIADLLRHGLLRPSFVPPRPQREFRELTRYRTTLVRERSAEVNRLQKTLEGANIKLAAVASNILGTSSREMLAQVIAGATDGAALAELARGRLRAKRPQLQQALTGPVGPHQRFLLARQLAHIDALEQLIAEVSTEIGQRLHAATGFQPPEPQAPPTTTVDDAPATLAAIVQRLQTIPGVGQRAAEILVAEVGVDLQRFPSAAHLASWAGLCPGNHESAGKRRSGRTRRGSPWLRTLLVEAAQAASRTKETALAARFRRLTGRLGYKTALLALAHANLRLVYARLKNGTTYQERGPQIDDQARDAAIRLGIRRLQALGRAVTVAPAPPTA